MKPQMNSDKHRYDDNEITERIIGSAFKVSNTLGAGFLEKVYENALCHELQQNGLNIQQQEKILVRYDNIVVGEYIADILVESRILVELKAVRTLDEIHLAQCLNYLKATNLKLCLLLNFGNSKIDVKRVILD